MREKLAYMLIGFFTCRYMLPAARYLTVALLMMLSFLIGTEITNIKQFIIQLLQ